MFVVTNCIYILQVDGTPVALRECFIPLNPVRFSSSVLVAMERKFPSALDGGVPTSDEVHCFEIVCDGLSNIVKHFCPHPWNCVSVVYEALLHKYLKWNLKMQLCFCHIRHCLWNTRGDPLSGSADGSGGRFVVFLIHGKGICGALGVGKQEWNI